VRAIVGLGNPGPEYDGTRHNAGFLLADHLVQRWGFGTFKRGTQARNTAGRRQGEEVLLFKPWTYMNRSGAALAPLRSIPGFDPARDLLVLVDDFHLDVGRFRLRPGGSAGGHNGMKSIEGTLRNQQYARLRIGVGPLPPGTEDTADFVLGPFSRDERDALQQLLDPMAEAVEVWIAEGIEAAMNRFNK
jgi:peptidyl-tRNA hydrolase, PTH1 family